MHTMKVYNTRPWQFFLFFFFRPVVFTCYSNQRFEAIEFVDRHVSESSKFNLSKAFFAKHALLRSRNGSYSQFPWSVLGTPGTMTPLLCRKNEEKRVADYESCCLRKRD